VETSQEIIIYLNFFKGIHILQVEKNMSFEDPYYEMRVYEGAKRLSADDIDDCIHILGLEVPYMSTKEYKIGMIIHRALTHVVDNVRRINPRVEHIIFTRHWSELSSAEKAAMKRECRTGLTQEICEKYKVSRSIAMRGLNRRRALCGVIYQGLP
jgi:hypothetical protein